MGRDAVAMIDLRLTTGFTSTPRLPFLPPLPAHPPPALSPAPNPPGGRPRPAGRSVVFCCWPGLDNTPGDQKYLVRVNIIFCSNIILSSFFRAF